MSGDPSRRPSNDRTITAPIDATVWVECSACLGDGWVRPGLTSANPRKSTCQCCGGLGRVQKLAIARLPQDRIVIANDEAAAGEGSVA